MPLPKDGHEEAPDIDPGLSAVLDKDGIVVPEVWRANVAKWEGLPIGWRANQSKMYLKDQAKPKKEPKASKPAAKRFTTQACINWGRRKGWKLVAREAYDYRTKRHHDTLLGSDAVFDTPNGMVAVQGAGRSERAVHMERFNERGGVSAAARMRIGFVYVEFVRGKDEPVVEEWWAES